jgi:hypothetical protein
LVGFRPLAIKETPPEPELERLQARVEALEAALEARSRELRSIQEHCCARDLALVERIRIGLSTRTRYAYDPALWQETIELTPTEVEPMLSDLWRSLTPRAALDDDAS